MNQARIDQVTQHMRQHHLEQLILSDPATIFYLTGHWILPGERLLVLALSLSRQPRLFLNALFPLALPEDSELELHYFNDTDDSVAFLAEHLEDTGEIGVEKTWPACFLLPLMAALPHANFVNGSFAVDEVRMLKDSTEQAAMREASRLNDQAMAALTAEITGGCSEQSLSRRLKELYETLGADSPSFTPIIGFGPNTALPHHDTGSALLQPGDAIILDIGCLKDHYCSDMTRTFFYKTVSEKAKAVYDLVLKANLAAIAAVGPGVKFSEVDAAARKVIEDGGYGPFFTHRTGHSIGIEVHEHGDVSGINDALLKPGMIFSIEPGIYLQGEFGVRIEDLVLVTETGCEVLNHFSKALTLIE